MNENQSRDDIQAQVAEIYASDSRRVFATLIRLLGDFDLAEEAMHDAFTAAVEQWQRDGLPKNPRAWLVSTGRFKAIDVIRRRSQFDASLRELADRWEQRQAIETTQQDESVEDDRLRLIFTCCHPALSPSIQVPLTLREVCGLSTETIASAFLTQTSTIAQRIVRGKAKIRDAKIPYVVPSLPDLPERLDSVLAVIYLVFNEGYYSSSGEALTRPDLSAEAIRLGRLTVELLSDAEAMGLLALMLLQESRRAARSTREGDVILLEDQDRSLWNQSLIREGKELLEGAFATGRIGSYTIQAAIAAIHAGASSASETDWAQIVALYDVLMNVGGSPVIALNRAVAISMRDGPQTGLAIVDEILREGGLAEYPLAFAARADFCRRLGREEEARQAYERAIELTKQVPERRFLLKRLAEIDGRKP